MLTGHVTDADMISASTPAPTTTSPSRSSSPVLLARIRAQLRQHEQSEDAVFAVGPYTFRPAAKVLLDERGRRSG